MHFIGGIWTAFAIIFLFHRQFILKIEKGELKRIVLLVLLGVGLLALGYEIFEFSLQSILSLKNLASPIDSISDLAFGLAGATVSILYLFIKSHE